MSKQKYTLSARGLFVADKREKSTRFSYPGVILRIGPSDLTNDTIATIAILNSTNRKTGDMIQIYYLPVNEPPTEAVKTGADASVCGDCKLRPLLAKEKNIKPCYVKKFHGPSAVYRSFKAGKYPHLDKMKPRLLQGVLQLLATKPVRLGAWGEPASDLETSTFLASLAPQITAYTHEWRQAPQLKLFCMASVDSPSEYAIAKDGGWRTYRHTTDNLAFQNEIVCPHKSHDVQCVTCGLCSGTSSNSARDIVTTTI